MELFYADWEIFIQKNLQEKNMQNSKQHKHVLQTAMSYIPAA